MDVPNAQSSPHLLREAEATLLSWGFCSSRPAADVGIGLVAQLAVRWPYLISMWNKAWLFRSGI